MRTAAAITAFMLALGVAGCSADEAEPATLPAVGSAEPSASAPQSSAEPSRMQPSSSGTPSETAPPEALGTSSRAAREFTRYFFQVVNDAYVAREPSGVRELSDRECGSCAAVVSDISRLAAEGHRVAGRRYILSSAEAAPPMSDGRVLVEFRFTTDPYVERDAGGRLVNEFPAEAARDGQMLLVRSGQAWRVTAIRLLG